MCPTCNGNQIQLYTLVHVVVVTISFLLLKVIASKVDEAWKMQTLTCQDCHLPQCVLGG